MGSASPRAVRVCARVRSLLLRPPGRESLGSGEQETEAAIETPPSIGVLRGVGDSEARRRVLGLMLGARESAQVLILASLESRDSLGFLS